METTCSFILEVGNNLCSIVCAFGECDKLKVTPGGTNTGYIIDLLYFISKLLISFEIKPNLLYLTPCLLLVDVCGLVIKVLYS